jgi:hypothetical protein
LGRPIHQVEVEIILEPWSIQNLVRVGSNLPLLGLLSSLSERVIDEHILSVDKAAIEVILIGLLGRLFVFENFTSEHTFLFDILIQLLN